MVDEWNMCLRHWWNDTDGRTKVLWEKHALLPLNLWEMLHGMPLDWTWLSAVTGWWLTVWVMAQLYRRAFDFLSVREVGTSPITARCYAIQQWNWYIAFGMVRSQDCYEILSNEDHEKQAVDERINKTDAWSICTVWCGWNKLKGRTSWWICLCFKFWLVVIFILRCIVKSWMISCVSTG